MYVKKDQIINDKSKINKKSKISILQYNNIDQNLKYAYFNLEKNSIEYQCYYTNLHMNNIITIAIEEEYKGQTILITTSNDCSINIYKKMIIKENKQHKNDNDDDDDDNQAEQHIHKIYRSKSSETSSTTAISDKIIDHTKYRYRNRSLGSLTSTTTTIANKHITTKFPYQLLNRLYGHNDNIIALALSLEYNILVSSSINGQAIIWHVYKGIILYKVSLPMKKSIPYIDINKKNGDIVLVQADNPQIYLAIYDINGVLLTSYIDQANHLSNITSILLANVESYQLREIHSRNLLVTVIKMVLYVFG